MHQQVFATTQTAFQQSLAKFRKMKPSKDELYAWLGDALDGLDGANQLSCALQEVRNEAASTHIQSPWKELATAFVSCVENDVEKLERLTSKHMSALNQLVELELVQLVVTPT